MANDRPGRCQPSTSMTTDSMDYLIRDFPHLDSGVHLPGISSLRPSVGHIEFDPLSSPFLRRRRMEQVKQDSDEFGRSWYSLQPNGPPALSTSDFPTLPLEALPLSVGPPLFTNDHTFSRAGPNPSQQRSSLLPSTSGAASSQQINTFSQDLDDVKAEPRLHEAAPLEAKQKKSSKLPSRKPWRRRRELLLPASTRKKNREAQQRFREKQKERKMEMSNELDQLREENAALAARVASLERLISDMGGRISEDRLSPESRQQETPSAEIEA